MAPFVFLRVPSVFDLQSAKNGWYIGTSIATFHSVLPQIVNLRGLQSQSMVNAVRVVTCDCAISLGNAPVPPDFLHIYTAKFNMPADQAQV